MTPDPIPTSTSRSPGGLAADLASCIGFFSLIRVGAFHGASAGAGRPLAEAVRVLPVASVVIALPAAVGLWLAAALGFSPLVAGVVAVALLAAVTGGLHEDGLADVADGFGGGRDKARILEIMRDSRIGTFGTLALIIAFGLRVGLLAEAVADGGAGTGFLLVLAAAAVSRTILLYPWAALPPARRDGLAVSAGPLRLAVFRMAALLAIVIAAVLVLPMTLFGLLAGLVAAGTAGSVIAGLADRRIGGHSGDVLGATQQLSEIAFMAGVLIFLA